MNFYLKDDLQMEITV